MENNRVKKNNFPCFIRKEIHRNSWTIKTYVRNETDSNFRFVAFRFTCMTCDLSNYQTAEQCNLFFSLSKMPVPLSEPDALYQCHRTRLNPRSTLMFFNTYKSKNSKYETPTFSSTNCKCIITVIHGIVFFKIREKYCPLVRKKKFKNVRKILFLFSIKSRQKLSGLLALLRFFLRWNIVSEAITRRH